MDLIQTYNVIGIDTEFPGITNIPLINVEDKDFEY